MREGGGLGTREHRGRRLLELVGVIPERLLVPPLMACRSPSCPGCVGDCGMTPDLEGSSRAFLVRVVGRRRARGRALTPPSRLRCHLWMAGPRYPRQPSHHRLRVYGAIPSPKTRRRCKRHVQASTPQRTPQCRRHMAWLVPPSRLPRHRDPPSPREPRGASACLAGEQSTSPGWAASLPALPRSHEGNLWGESG